MTRFLSSARAAAALASVALGNAPAPPPAAPPPEPSFRTHLAIAPLTALVFAGGRAQFRVIAAGAAPQAVRWSVVGPGTIDAEGEYRATPQAGSTSQIVASANGMAAAASVTVVEPPGAKAPLAVISCYEDGVVDVRDAKRFASAGTTSTGGRAAGIAVDRGLRVAFVATGDRVSALNLRSARLWASNSVAGARFSEVALLGRRFLAATDNDAGAGMPGIRIFATISGAAPKLVSSAAGGDTPEGIAASQDGREFYVTNVNGNSVMRYQLDSRGVARRVATAPTGHRPFGVALDERRRLLFVADNDTPTVSGNASRPGVEVFSLPSLRRIAVLSTGSPNALPLGVAVDGAANRLFVTNEGDGTVAAYSIAPLRRIGTLPAGRTPWLPVVDAASGRLFVPSAMGNSFSVFDETTLRPLAAGISTCGYPTSIGVAD